MKTVSKNLKIRIKRGLASGLCSTALMAATVAAYAEAGADVRISMNAQSVSASMLQLAELSGVQIIVSQNVDRSIKLPSLDGVYSAQGALNQLLAGTGLTYEFTSSNVVVVKTDAAGSADSGADSKSEASDSFVLEEIIVTAEKRAESVMDLPIAITAFSSKRLADAGVEDMYSLKQLAPSLQIGGGNVTNFVTIRGIGSELEGIGAETGVAISQDGVVLGRSIFFDADFLDVERVEVLRGPQGTISGRNATGGGINIYSKRPTEEFEAGIKATIGNYNRFSTEGYISGALMGNDLLARFAFKTDDADGWIKNTLQDRTIENRDNIHARASFLATPQDNLEVLLILEGSIDKSIGQGFFVAGRVRPDVPSAAEFFDTPIIDLEKLEYEGDQLGYGRNEKYAATLNIAWDITPTATLVSTSGYRYLDYNAAFDYDGTALSISQNPYINVNVWQFTQELTLTADLADRLDLIFGGLYLSDKAEQPVHYASEVQGISEFSSRPFGGPEQNLKSYSVYSQLRYRFTEALRISAGVRYTYDTKTYASLGGVFNGINLLDDFWVFSVEENWSAVTPRVSLDYTLNDSVMLFANVARGFKAGGFNTYSTPADVFNPEYVWNYEAGAKISAWDGRARFAVTAFYSDYTDLQQNVFGTFDGTTFTGGVENAAAATIKGAELEVDAWITEALTITGALTWLDTKFSELKSQDNIFPELGVQDFSGNTLVKAPEWQFNVGAKYVVPVSATMDLALRADYLWQDHTFFNFYNHDSMSQGSYGLLNLRASFEETEGRWEIGIFANNVFDKRYFSRGSTNPGTDYSSASFNVGAPRMYGVSLAYKF